ncbi:MAG: hypothetical protein EZS28_029076 [Streblomastix strix]|uniref:Uncharacterized protein n=1 Tax=Streblomastix strix TaxID=222440 RepID=A0A5J4UXD8_9EUKA|nr:MAG: hypothetical protein EZS28_029076 [Streblomastix strix]
MEYIEKIVRIVQAIDNEKENKQFSKNEDQIDYDSIMLNIDEEEMFCSYKEQRLKEIEQQQKQDNKNQHHCEQQEMKNDNNSGCNDRSFLKRDEDLTYSEKEQRKVDQRAKFVQDILSPAMTMEVPMEIVIVVGSDGLIKEIMTST